MTLVEVLAVGFPESTLGQRILAAQFGCDAATQISGRQLKDSIFSKWSGASHEMTIEQQISHGIRFFKFKSAFNRLSHMAGRRDKA